MTFSIVARDARTGALGVATVTAGPAVGALVPHGKAGTGAVATQAMTNPYLAMDLLERIEALGADAALGEALTADPESERRQIITVDAKGDVAGWTGSACQDFAGHRLGDGVAVAGNILAGEAVLDRMLDAAMAPLDLARRLLDALQAGDAAGGDRRGANSAALRVFGQEAYPDVDLRIDWSEDPVADLAALLDRTQTGSYADFFSRVLKRG